MTTSTTSDLATLFSSGVNTLHTILWRPRTRAGRGGEETPFVKYRPKAGTSVIALLEALHPRLVAVTSLSGLVEALEAIPPKCAAQFAFAQDGVDVTDSGQIIWPAGSEGLQFTHRLLMQLIAWRREMLTSIKARTEGLIGEVLADSQNIKPDPLAVKTQTAEVPAPVQAATAVDVTSTKGPVDVTSTKQGPFPGPSMGGKKGSRVP